MHKLTLFAIPNFPLVQPGDDLGQLIVDGLTDAHERLEPGDILVLAQKIVSKAEGRFVPVSGVTPDLRAQEIGALTGKDPRIVQVILSETREIVRAAPGLLIVEQQAGWICANGGMDRSNVSPDNVGEGEGELLLLLPADPDASAGALRQRLTELTGIAPGVIINDSHGRPWRMGTAGVCIGCAGLPPIWDQRGRHDLFGYELKVSEECIADELAAAASLVMGQSNEGRPVVVVRGYTLPEDAEPAPARTIQRPKERDMFR